MRQVPQRAIDFIKDFEGVELRAYEDVAGVLTIGFGHTRDVRRSLIITPAIAERYLLEDLGRVAADISRTVKPDVLARLTDSQYAALVSFGFNLGVNPKDGVWGVVNRGEFDRVPARMQLYNKARVGGKLVKVAGLTRRRLAEAALWEEGQGEDIRLTAFAAETPPTPREKPAAKSWTIWGAISAPFLYVASQFKDAYDALKDWLTPDTVKQGIVAITPYAQQSELVAHALTALATLAAVLVAWGVISKHKAARS